MQKPRLKEAHDVGRDADSQARIVRLTTFPCVSHNIYFENAYMDSASRHVIFARQMHPLGDIELWRADLESLAIEYVDQSAFLGAGVAMAYDLSHLYYFKRDKESVLLCSLDPATLEKSEMRVKDFVHPASLAAVDPDKECFYYESTERGHSEIISMDLQDGTSRVVFSSKEFRSRHPQLNPADNDELLIQTQRAGKTDQRGGAWPEHIGLAVLQLSEGSLRHLPVTPPHTAADCQGHQCFIGETGKVLLTLRKGPDSHLEESHTGLGPGNLVSVSVSGGKARLVSDAFAFSHPHASRDGRFFVSDTAQRQIIAGSLETGRHLKICETHASFCSAQYTHPHPYFSPDCRWIIFNSDATGVPHLYAAELPDGLLESLL